MSKKLEELYISKYGVKPQINKLIGGGSQREYFRLSEGGATTIGVCGEDARENEIFLNLSFIFKDVGIKVPEIILVSKDKKCYLLQDLGDMALMSALHTPENIYWAKRALEELIDIQLLPENIWKHSVGFTPFSERLIRWDLNYFKYDFLKPASIDFNEEQLEDDFDKLASRLLDPGITNGLMYRDFQSRNIMIKDNQLYFIDYQGARKGPVVYDAVSFIWQAKAPFSYPEREELCNFYALKLSERIKVSQTKIANQFPLIELFRTLQVLGAYGFRGLIEKKSHFIESLPLAVKNLKYLKDKGNLSDYPEISNIAEKLVLKFLQKEEEKENCLNLLVYSFSYKKGYPEDTTSHGGGFIFDCRGIHNPGRFVEYKKLTGKDSEVKEFLENKTEAPNFIENIVNLVTPSVAKYLERGFTFLTVGFGCTGGQHRSVYCAEKFGNIMAHNFPQIKVKIIHREQNF